MANNREGWSSRIGVILAVSGSAVGIGNFLRFPGQVAEFGGGAFMIAYFTAFLLLGLPMCWAEWTLGRYGGRRGYNSIPGIMSVVAPRPYAKYLGCISMLLPTIVFMYIICIQGWCMAYALNLLSSSSVFENQATSEAFFSSLIGVSANGAALGIGLDKLAGYVLVAFVFNFILLYRGLAKGIELFCKYAMPTLIIIALILLVRVLTLGTPNLSLPENTVGNGLGFLWNPEKVLLEEITTTTPSSWTIKEELVGEIAINRAEETVRKSPETLRIHTISVVEQLKKPRLWLAACGQIFFSLTVGFGVIATYSSYLSEKDDIVLSGLSATSANEFCEVALGGLMTIPASVAFLGVAGIASDTSLFSLGFKALPLVFSSMPGGLFFGFIFFFLLALACTSGCIAALQPAIAFFEEALNIQRKPAVTILGLIAGLGSFFVLYFSHQIKALDTLDFWVGTFLIFIMGFVYSILFGWFLGTEKGFQEANQGASFCIPNVFKGIIRYVCPSILITIFILWILLDVLCIGTGPIDHHITDLIGNRKEGTPPNSVALLSIGFIIVLGAFFCLIAKRSHKYR
jgi:SNF family Na+-dependent transporter